MEKIRYFLVRYSYYSNYRSHTVCCYATDEKKAKEKFEKVNDHFDYYNVSINEIWLTKEEVKASLEEVGQRRIELNGYNENYFVL